MPSQDPANEERDFPSICASYDQGGGVGLGDAFVVYTTDYSRPDPEHFESGILKTLSTLASTVASHVKTYYSLTQAASLRSLPRELIVETPRLGKKYLDERDRPQLPSFFVNASSCRDVCIAGFEDDVTTLLGVLRRPWCMLELCSAGTVEAVKALLAFAEAADTVDPKGYRGAAALLRHQIECQIIEGSQEVKNEVSGWIKKSKSLNWRSRKLVLKNICATLFESSLSSYNGFYMRAIVACAIEAGVDWRTMGRLLAGDKSLINKHIEGCAVRDASRRGPVDPDYVLRASSTWFLGPGRTCAALPDLQRDKQTRNSVGVQWESTRVSFDNDQKPAFGSDTPKIFFKAYKVVLERLAFDVT